MNPILGILAVLALALPTMAEVTYSKEISRLYQGQNARDADRAGDIAPFALDSYEAAKTWGADIQRVVREKIMPPWETQWTLRGKV